MGIVQEIGKFVNEEEKGFIRTKEEETICLFLFLLNEYPARSRRYFVLVLFFLPVVVQYNDTEA